MHLPTHLGLPYPNLAKRAGDGQSKPSSQTVFLYVTGAIVIFFAILLLLYSILSRRGLIPKFASSKNGWQFWKSQNKSYGQLSTHDRLRSLSSANTSHHRVAPTDESDARDDDAARSHVQAGVDRNTSVRSVMTLPAYSQKPKESERIIGREGERAGVDTVVEFPETADEEENRRDDEMESLYQIRLARRREVEERERHRQERADARDRGDRARLEELRFQSRARAQSSTSDVSNIDVSAATMLAEHRSRGRERRVSSISYAAVGQVSHNGSRIRASQESERGGLLDGVAPMGDSESHGRALSGSSSFFSAVRTRNRSASSLSISTAASDLDPTQSPQITPAQTRSEARLVGGRRSPYGNDPVRHGTSESSPAAQGLTPEISSSSDDIGESIIPQTLIVDTSAEPQPPSYDAGWGEAPAYQGPAVERGILAASNSRGDEAIELHGDSVSRRMDGVPTRIPSRAPRLPQLSALPSINVEGATEPNTPLSPVRRPDNFSGT